MIAIRPLIFKYIPGIAFKRNIIHVLDLVFYWKERMNDYSSLHRSFRNGNGYDLNLKNPKTHHELIQIKKLTDRDPLLVLTSDKYKVRAYIKKMLGPELSKEILIPLFFTVKDARDIPFERLPPTYFLKANHFSGANLLVTPETNREMLIKTANHWLANTYGQKLHEWAYKRISPRLIGEKLLLDSQGKIPPDIKFYCFHGRVKLIMLVDDRMSDMKMYYFDEFLTEIQMELTWDPFPRNRLPADNILKKMKEIASVLASPFDFVRVDMYAIEDRIFFGEMTHYCGSGIDPFPDVRLDKVLGKYWDERFLDYDLIRLLREEGIFMSELHSSHD